MFARDSSILPKDPSVVYTHNEGQIKSPGTLDNVSNQGTVALAVRFGGFTSIRDKNPNCSTKKGEVYAPAQYDVNTERVRRHQVAIAFPTASFKQGNTRRGPSTLPSVVCTTSMNGIPAKHPGVFIGTVAMEGMGSGNDDTRDNVGSVKVAGMENIVNEGTDHVRSGDTIGVDTHSLSIMTRNGEEIPGIVLGSDVQGLELTNRYAPRIYVMHSKNVISEILAAQLTIDKALLTLQPDSGKETIIRIASNYNQRRSFHSSFPINALMYMMLAERLLNMNDGGILQNHMTSDECRQVLDHCFKVYFEWKRLHSKKFIDINSKTENPDAVADKFKSITADLNDRKTVSGMRFVISDAIMRLQNYQNDHNNRQRIGLALSPAAPGQPFDILLRA